LLHNAVVVGVPLVGSSAIIIFGRGFSLSCCFVIFVAVLVLDVGTSAIISDQEGAKEEDD